MSYSLEKAKRDRECVAALFHDLDDIKSANDRVGHAGGDELLRSMARTLSKCIRRSEITALLGGDEFSVIVEDFSDPLEVESMADHVLVAC